MKIFKLKIKLLILFLALILSVDVIAQKETKKRDLFLRVYNLDGKKIGNGYVAFINDSILGLKKRDEIDVQNIGFVKTKRSAGNNVLMGSLFGVLTGAGLGASSADPDTMFFSYTATEGAAFGGVGGAVVGGVIGAITIPFKKSKSYVISGDLLKWKEVKEMITRK